MHATRDETTDMKIPDSQHINAKTILSFYTWMGKKHFCFFQTAETGNRTPDSSVKGSGANHYPIGPPPQILVVTWKPARRPKTCNSYVIVRVANRARLLYHAGMFWQWENSVFDYTTTHYHYPLSTTATEYGVLYGIRRSLIVIGSITEVKQRRARSIIGWVSAWDCQVLYTPVGLREPRKSDGSSDWPRVGRKRTSMDVGAVSIRRDPRKSTMCEYLAHKANLLGIKIAWCASMAAQLYISQETELEFEW